MPGEGGEGLSPEGSGEPPGLCKRRSCMREKQRTLLKVSILQCRLDEKQILRGRTQRTTLRHVAPER
jgi:hypothetical protein